MSSTMNQNNPIANIEAVDLTKRYDDGLLALDVLNLKVGPGEIYCLLGANGSGKTTALNLFVNFIQPSSGRALVCGINVRENPRQAKRYIAYVAEDVMLYGNFSARQNLEFFVRLGGKSELTREDYYMALREVGLQEKAFEQRLRHFSKGMRQKVSLAIAISLDAPVMLLDEPTTGLDPKAAAEFLELLDQQRQRGKAILVATQDIFRAKDIANRVGIMMEGRKVIEHTRDELASEDIELLYLKYMRSGLVS
ncbi:MAG TPA: ABC transporter ATP-binding protein [Blastocatellia bacterium]|nr:ABC transporter ATP-binding protein [Blastocatellia bacterium]